MKKDDEKMINEIKQNTKSGRPCGDEYFMKKVEVFLGRRLMALPRGRPRKKE